MRRGLLLVLGFIGLAVAGWLWWQPAPPPPSSTPALPPPVASKSKWEATVAPRGDKSLTGRVTFKGAALADAQVLAVAANAGEPLLTERPCSCAFSCGKTMLECDFGTRSEELEDLLATRTGEAVPIARTTTDAEGRFSLAGLGDEVITLWAESSSGVKRVGFRVGVSSGASDVELTVSAARTLEGVVQRGDAPVAGALVTAVLHGLPRFFDAVSAADGTFTLDGVPEGRWVLFASSGDARTLSSAYEHDYRKLELQLLAPRQVKGQVLLNDAPVADVEVALETQSVNPPRTRTDATGTFVFEGVRRDVATVSVDDVRGVGSAGVNLRYESQEPLVIRLVRSRTVRGRVVDEAGRAVPSVSLVVRDNVREQTATTGPDGRFEVKRVSVGPCSLSLDALGYLGAYEAFSADEVNVTLQRAALVRGRVVRPGSAPVMVSARRNATPDEASAADDTEGWYDTANVVDGGFALRLVPGRYVVSVSGEGVRPIERELTAPADDVVFELSGGARLVGRVLDAQGAPEPGINVIALCPSKVEGEGPHDEQSTQTDALGEFELGGLGACEAVVLVSAPRASFERKAVLRDGETTRIELKPDLGAPLAGVVIDSQGEPVEGATVQAINMASTRQSVSVTTDAKGAFRLLGLPAGKAMLTAFLDSRDSQLDVEAPNEALTVKLASKTEIVGRVVDSSGRPVTSFSMHGTPVESAEGRFSQQVYGQATQLMLEAKGYVPRTVEVKLKEGKNELGDLVLVTGRQLQGRVVDLDTGEPLASVRVRQLGNRRTGTMTEVDGRFSLTLDPSAKELVFDHRDYVVRKGPAPEQSPCEVALSRGLTLSVRVFEAGGKPLRAVSVRARQGSETRVLRPSNGTFSAAGFFPGRWTVLVEGSSHRVWHPVEVELSGASVSLDVREATDGVTVKVTVPEARFIGLVPGEVTIATYHELTDQVVVLEVTQGAANHVPPGRWTVLAVKSPPKDFHGLLLSRTVIDVPAEGAPVFSLTPEWVPVAGVPGDE